MARPPKPDVPGDAYKVAKWYWNKTGDKQFTLKEGYSWQQLASGRYRLCRVHQGGKNARTIVETHAPTVAAYQAAILAILSAGSTAATHETTALSNQAPNPPTSLTGPTAATHQKAAISYHAPGPTPSAGPPIGSSPPPALDDVVQFPPLPSRSASVESQVLPTRSLQRQAAALSKSPLRVSQKRPVTTSNSPDKAHTLKRFKSTDKLPSPEIEEVHHPEVAQPERLRPISDITDCNPLQSNSPHLYGLDTNTASHLSDPNAWLDDITIRAAILPLVIPGYGLIGSAFWFIWLHLNDDQRLMYYGKPEAFNELQIILPLHVSGNHWVVLHLVRDDHSIVSAMLYDSMSKPNDMYDVVSQVLKQIHVRFCPLRTLLIPQDMLHFVQHRDCQQQVGSSDCAVFVWVNAYFIMGVFLPECVDVSGIRKRYAEVLRRGKTGLDSLTRLEALYIYDPNLGFPGDDPIPTQSDVPFEDEPDVEEVLLPSDPYSDAPTERDWMNANLRNSSHSQSSDSQGAVSSQPPIDMNNEITNPSQFSFMAGTLTGPVSAKLIRAYSRTTRSKDVHMSVVEHRDFAFKSMLHFVRDVNELISAYKMYTKIDMELDGNSSIAAEYTSRCYCPAEEQLLTTGDRTINILCRMHNKTMWKILRGLDLMTEEELRYIQIFGLTLSHLCGKGNSGCRNPFHIVWECRALNSSRNTCHKPASTTRSERCTAMAHSSHPCFVYLGQSHYLDLFESWFGGFNETQQADYGYAAMSRVNNYTPPAVASDSVVKPKKTYLCHVKGCTFSGNGKQNLERHFKVSHPQDEALMLRCPIKGCIYEADRKDRVIRHIGSRHWSHLSVKQKIKYAKQHRHLVPKLKGEDTLSTHHHEQKEEDIEESEADNSAGNDIENSDDADNDIEYDDDSDDGSAGNDIEDSNDSDGGDDSNDDSDDGYDSNNDDDGDNGTITVAKPSNNPIEPVEKKRCLVGTCTFAGDTQQDLDEHTKSEHPLEDVGHCPFSWCRYSNPIRANLKRHISSRHWSPATTNARVKLSIEYPELITKLMFQSVKKERMVAIAERQAKEQLDEENLEDRKEEKAEDGEVGGEVEGEKSVKVLEILDSEDSNDLDSSA